MISTPVSIFAEIIVLLASLALEMCVLILLASIRPWRYLLSSTFRAKINAEHAKRNPVIKRGYLLWGSVLLIASVAVIIGLVSLWPRTRTDTQPPHGLRQQAVEKAQHAVLEQFKKHEGK